MNEIQLSYELAKYIEEISQKAIPTATGTVLKVVGNVVYLVDSPSATADIFFGGQLKVTSGIAEGLRTSIVESAANQIIVAGAFTGEYSPQPGDTVELGPGPLAQARVFMFEPETVAPQNAEPFFITVNPIGRTTEWRTMNNKVMKGWFTLKHEIRFEVVAEAMKTLPNGDDLAALRDSAFNLKILSEILEVIIIDFRLDERNRLHGSGPLETTYNMIQRTGADTMRYAAITEFDVTQV